MKKNSPVIPAGQLTAYERWELPTLGEPTVAAPPASAVQKKQVIEEESPLNLPTAQELEAIRKSAYEEGRAQGHQEGLRAGQERGYQEGLQNAREEVTAQATRLASMFNALTQPLHNQEEVLEQDLLELVRQLASAVLDHQLQQPLQALAPYVRKLLEAITQRAAALNIQLNPADAALLRAHLQQSDVWQSHWNITENPVISQGGCIVESPQQYIDARREIRQNAVWALLDTPHDPA